MKDVYTILWGHYPVGAHGPDCPPGPGVVIVGDRSIRTVLPPVVDLFLSTGYHKCTHNPLGIYDGNMLLGSNFQLQKL